MHLVTIKAITARVKIKISINCYLSVSHVSVHCLKVYYSICIFTLRFKYTTTFSLPKIACPAIVYAEIVVVIDPFFVCVYPWIKVYRYNPTEICQQRLQGVQNVAQKLCSWERSFNLLTFFNSVQQLCSDSIYDKRLWPFMSQEGIFTNFTNNFPFLNFLLYITTSARTIWTDYRNDPKFEEQSDQGLHCLPFHLHRLDSLLYGRAI